METMDIFGADTTGISAELSTHGCMYNYVVTAHKPTAVTHSACGSFTSATDLNLIIAKCTRIEIHRLTEEGLQGVVDVPIYGRIATMELFRPKNEPKDLLFVSTERYKFFVVDYDEATGELVTRANGDLRGLSGRPTDSGQIGIVDPECRVVGLHLYEGLFKVIPLDGSRLQESFDIRLEELQVIDLKFLHGFTKPTLAVLHQDPKGNRHLKTYEIRDKDFTAGPWTNPHLDPGARIIIPVPGRLGGAIIVGETSVEYSSPGNTKRTPMRRISVQAWGRIDDNGQRYLLSDHTGMLHLLLLRHDDDRVLGLTLEPLGRASPASALSYLDNGVVFVGSSTADSQLIKLHKAPISEAEPGSFIEVLDSFTNLGPIVDFSVVDLERQGQGQVVTCSGVYKEGSLRIVRNGIGINEQANVDLPGIKGIWSLRASSMDAYDKFLVVTFVGETRVLAMNDEEELEESEIPGFDAEAQTLYCGNVLHDQVLQVTRLGVRLADAKSGRLLLQWSPPDGHQVNGAAANASQVVLSTGDGMLLYLEIGQQALQEVAQVKLDSEISCLDITPLDHESGRSSLVAVGTWARDLLVYSLPALAPLSKELLGGEVIPRSVLMASFEGEHFLLCALGDGYLFNFGIDQATGALSNRKKLSLGTKPITLWTFVSNGASHVFAASDRPTVIYYSNKKLLYSNLNQNEVNFMTSFNSGSFPNSLAIATESSMVIGNIDEIQKLHIRTVPLGEQPRRIAHQDSTRTFGVVTLQHPGQMSDAEESSFLRLVDDQTFEVVDGFKLDSCEIGCSIVSCSFSDDTSSYYVVGTAYALPEESEPSKGRLLVFQVVNGKLLLVTDREVKGGVYNVSSFHGGILAGINSRIQLWKWSQKEDSSKELQAECSHVGHILALHVATRGDFIVVGDLMKSISLLIYKPDEHVIEERARDYDSNWMMSVDILDDDTYLGGENSYNIFSVRKNSDAATDEERMRLEPVGEMHVGELINRFRHGSLVMRLPDSESSNIQTVLFGTINGVIGVVASLPQAVFEKLTLLQTALRKVIKGVGGLSHAEWRSFDSERRLGTGRPEQQRCFVDGDLIEQFLDLRREKMVEVAAEMGPDHSVEDLCKVVEELTRLH
mmetsp:Transcript_12957/g.36428  ORF Transcript_12957/g.36428 Transcript_12957/m.36428 type:complete len:1117 (+) Transcript_12957:258-3608(+)